MRRLILAAFGVLAVAGVAPAQQPQYQQPIRYPAMSPGAAAATPVQPASGATVIRGNGGCTNCGPAASEGAKGHGSFTMSKVTGGNCSYAGACQSGCGSLKSDLSFHFGSCKQFFAPCGPNLGGKCGALGFAQPWGTGWQCPPAYDSHANH